MTVSRKNFLMTLLILVSLAWSALAAAPAQALAPGSAAGFNRSFAGDPTDDFVITVKTDNAGTSSSTKFTIPTSPYIYSYNYNVDCDNNGVNEATGQTGSYTCTYASAGTYTLRIKDNIGDGTGFPSIYFAYSGDRFKLLTIEQWGTGKWISMSSAFDGCQNLAGQASDAPDLSGVTEMSNMFAGARAFNQNIGGWNTAYVTDMSNMFANATAFNQNIGGWNTASVRDMSYMFANASAFNQNINGWNTASVTDMSYMFSFAAAFNQNIGGWDTANVTNMRSMFEFNTVFNQNIGSWNTANVTNMSYMFQFANAFNQNIGGWNTAKVTNMNNMFQFATAFNQNIGGWNTSSVTNMAAMFEHANAFNQNIGGWNTANVTSMSYLFEDAIAFNQDIGGWNTAKVTGMNNMFQSANAFNQNIGGWNVGALTTADNMFIGVTLSTSNYDALLNGWSAQPLKTGVIFSGGSSKYCARAAARASMIANSFWTITDGGGCLPANDFVITVKTNNSGTSTFKQFTIPTTGGGYNYNVDCNNDGVNEASAQTGDYTCTYAAAGTYTLRIKDNTGLGTGFPRIFFSYNGDRQKLLSIQQWGTGKWTSMNRAFTGCQNLAGQAVDVPDLSGVTDMSYMFADANAFNQNISGWNTASVTDMNNMFSGAIAFNQDIGNWNTANVTDMNNMLNSAWAFNQNIGSWNTARVTDMSYMFFGASAFNQNISSWNTAKVTDMNSMFMLASAFNQNIGSWNVGALAAASDMFTLVTLSTANYDALLNGWGAQLLKTGVSFSGGNSQYCAGAAARASMIADHAWAITDGGIGTCSKLTFSAGTGGSITAPAASPSIFAAGTVVTISAVPSANYHFVNWTGDVSTVANANAASTTITMNGAYSLTANFGLPSLTIAKTHARDFTLGQSGAEYRLTVTNDGFSPTTAPVTVIDSLPAGLTASGLSGTNWTCTLASLTCNRGDALAAGSSYEDILLTISVDNTAPASLTNTAIVSGGGEVDTTNNTAQDLTVINAAPDTSLTAQPGDPSPSPAASFTFTGSGGTAPLSFECQLDGSLWNTCASPKTYTALSSGSHTFQVRALDANNVPDGSPAGYTWQVLSAASAATQDATAVTLNAATLNGLVNPNNASTIVSFEYGTDTNYGSSLSAAQSPLSGTSDTPVTAALTGLRPNTTYHFRVVAENSAGKISAEDLTFTTLNATVQIDFHDALHARLDSLPAGQNLHASASVTGTGAAIPTGQITFSVFQNTSCSGTGAAAGTVSLNGSAAADPGAAAAMTNDGLSFRAQYSGDANYPAAESACAGISTSPYLTVLTFSTSNKPRDGAQLQDGLTTLFVQFSRDVLHDSSGAAHSALNPLNYLLVTPGVDGLFETTACGPAEVGGLKPDDQQLVVNSVTYDPATFLAALKINDAHPLPDGQYRLFICGTTSITDPAETLFLNNHSADSLVNFEIQQSPSETQGKRRLPATGFAQGRRTSLPEQPDAKAYTAYADLTLEIPALGLKTAIIGVPESAEGWDVTWLGSNAGWLNGTAFPTWSGNSVITGHVWDASNRQGIFVNLKQLKYGDQIQIHAWGQVYTYQVRTNETVLPGSTSAVLKHENAAWVTLLTCEDYNLLSSNYTQRRMVRAVLLSVSAEKPAGTR